MQNAIKDGSLLIWTSRWSGLDSNVNVSNKFGKSCCRVSTLETDKSAHGMLHKRLPNNRASSPRYNMYVMNTSFGSFVREKFAYTDEYEIIVVKQIT